MRRHRPLVLLAGLAAAGLLAGTGASAAEPASFTTYQAPEGLGDRAGEPTLGINPKTGAVLFQAYTETLRVTGFDAAGPGSSTWELGQFPVPQPRSFDPILRTDPDTGRTFTSQLLLACSQGGFTDDDAASFTLSTGCGPGSLFDHQSVGFGHYVEGSPLAALKNPVTDYPNVVYYCAQDVASAKCSMSTDGGITFPTTSVVYTTVECQAGGIFGHLKAAPDGTVYLPPRYCPDLTAGEYQTGVAVSEDNGLTWQVREAPGTVYGDAGHPSVGVGTNGDVYLGYGGPADGKTVFDSGPPMVVVSRDKGLTFSKPVNIAADAKILNSRFPVAVAGDAGRAAIGFVGSTTGGNGGETGIGADMQPNGEKPFAGRWDLYVSFTEDFGRTWRTVDATPDHPVQVGPICTGGTTCGTSRNLLDFNDAVIDPATGRVVVGYADGCPGTDPCTTDVRLQKASIARQTSGPSLLAAPVAQVPQAAPAGGGAPSSGGAPSTGGAPSSGGAPSTGAPSLAATGGLPLAAGALVLLAAAAWTRRRRRT